MGIYPEVGLECPEETEMQRKSFYHKVWIARNRKKKKHGIKLNILNPKEHCCSFDGRFEIWKGNNTMRLTLDEARFIGTLLTNITR